MKNINFEIEKKYFVKKLPNLENLKKYEIIQAYIETNPVLKIRQKNDKYFFTFKGKGLTKRIEFEQEITKEQFFNLLKKKEGIIIKKNRYIYPLDNNLFAEIDIFEEPFSDIIIVEVEFENENQAKNFTPPDWFGQDITSDFRYSNSYMSNAENLEKIKKNP